MSVATKPRVHAILLSDPARCRTSIIYVQVPGPAKTTLADNRELAQAHSPQKILPDLFDAYLD